MQLPYTQMQMQELCLLSDLHNSLNFSNASFLG